MMLYVSGPVTPSSNLFRKMMESERPLARQLAWQMAAALPGKNMQKNIEREINRSLIEGEERELLVPQMASAVQANRMVTAYTLVRQGLMETGHEDFATAMTVLNPDKARSDFLEYLAICPPEELRQISVSSINVYSANIALAHLAKNPPTVGHPKLEVLFYYSISRNPTLNELASAVLDNLTSKDQRG
ncbi:MAG: hypothetical protein NT027_20240, partial [Proteobacteria bacterium]|nr:hypothetical protein [Pseudomonadota bacterium]